MLKRENDSKSKHQKIKRETKKKNSLFGKNSKKLDTKKKKRKRHAKIPTTTKKPRRIKNLENRRAHTQLPECPPRPVHLPSSKQQKITLTPLKRLCWIPERKRQVMHRRPRIATGRQSALTARLYQHYAKLLVAHQNPRECEVPRSIEAWRAFLCGSEMRD